MVAETGLVRVEVPDEETLERLISAAKRGVPLEAFSIPQIGHHLVVVSLTGGELRFYDLGRVWSALAEYSWDRYKVSTDLTEGRLQGTATLVVRLNPGIKAPFH